MSKINLDEQLEIPAELGAEVIKWRGIDSKVYEKKGRPGDYQLVGFETPVHYMDTEGKLQDIEAPH